MHECAMNRGETDGEGETEGFFLTQLQKGGQGNAQEVIATVHQSESQCWFSPVSPYTCATCVELTELISSRIPQFKNPQRDTKKEINYVLSAVYLSSMQRQLGAEWVKLNKVTGALKC